MDAQALIFLQVMGGLILLAGLAFLIFLFSRFVGLRSQTPMLGGINPSQGRAQPGPPTYQPSWIEYLLAALLLLIVVGVLIWQFAPNASLWVEDPSGWRGEAKARTFFVVMLLLGAAGLFAFVIYAFVNAQAAARQAGAAIADDGQEISRDQPTAAAAAVPNQVSAATRLLGLLLLAVAFMLLNWIYVDAPRQYELMRSFVFPATLAVALVLLFDKVTRRWSQSEPGAEFSEWLFCDALIFLLCLAYLNLLSFTETEAYSALFWDMVNIVLFFLTFWLVDRTGWRWRFLLAHVYLVALPILLLIWRFSLDIGAGDAEGAGEAVPLSWWSSEWPFFAWAVVGVGLEITLLLVSGPERRSLPARVKDAGFFIVYAVLLMVAV